MVKRKEQPIRKKVIPWKQSNEMEITFQLKRSFLCARPCYSSFDLSKRKHKEHGISSDDRAGYSGMDDKGNTKGA